MVKKHKFIKNEYSDGSILTVEWDELYSGPWPYGENDIKIVKHKAKFYNDV